MSDVESDDSMLQDIEAPDRVSKSPSLIRLQNGPGCVSGHIAYQATVG